MYCIYQIDSSLVEKIIALIMTPNDFITIVKKQLPRETVITHLENIEIDVLANSCFSCGYYVINNNTTVHYIHKQENIECGYIYNVTNLKLVKMFTWKLLPIESREFLSDEDTSTDIEFDIPVKKIKKNDDIKITKELNNFDLGAVNLGSHISIIAKRGSGKSVLVCDIINNLMQKGLKENDMYIISPCDKFSSFYGQKYHNATIDVEYKSDTIDNYLTTIKNNGTFNVPKCVVLDCCITSTNWNKQQSLMELLYNARHYGITLILTTQFPYGFTLELRANFDYVFLLADDYISNQKRLYNHYCCVFPSFNIFSMYFKDVTQDYGTMVINNRINGCDLFDKVFKYKALIN